MEKCNKLFSTEFKFALYYYMNIHIVAQERQYFQIFNSFFVTGLYLKHYVFL
jgi:hypothetical protein